ncbi:MAG: YfhO family protein [Actinobacteria bacterium]|nr:YfhO family protein [Actinomycetota bacterium]
MIIGRGEEGLIFYNPSKNLELSKLTWVDVNTGMPNLSWLPRLPMSYLGLFLTSKLGLTQYIVQVGMFFLLMVTGVISMYYLILSFLETYPSKYLVSFISALFYLMNPFSVSQIWGRGLYPQYFAFALLPLSLLIMVKALRQQNFFYLFLLIFSSVIFSGGFGFVTFIVIYWTILIGYFIWWLFTNKLNKKEVVFGISFLSLFLFSWLLVNSWWFLPMSLMGNKILVAYLTNADENLGTLLGVSRAFPPSVIIRLLQKGYFFDATAYSQIYSTFTFQLISFIPPIFVLIGLVKTLKNKGLKKFNFFAVLLVLGLVVSLGANPPFGWLFVWIFKYITPLQAFRNPFEKFGLVYILGYSPLFAYGLVYILEKIKFKFLGLIIIILLTCGIYAWPMWTGRVLTGTDKKIGVKVPQYYEDLNTWLRNNDPQNYRLLMTPLKNGEAATFRWGDTTYNGVDPMHFILDRTAISNGAQIPFYYDFVQGIRQYIEREDLAPALSLLRAKFLIDRKDAIMISDEDKKQYQYLTSTIYPPEELESGLKVICQNMTADSKSSGVAWVICQIPPRDSDFSKVRYLHIKVKTDVPAHLVVGLKDANRIGNRWYGRADPYYYDTDTNDWQEDVTIPINNPTEGDKAIDLSKSSIVEVQANSKDYPEKSVGQINISEIKLDPGTKQQINEFRKVAEFGELTVFEPINFNPPPEFGVLASVNIVKAFPQLFEEANKKRDFINKEGFVLISQNDQKNLQGLRDATFTEFVDKYKISDTKYWIKFAQGQGKGLLILSKTFNPQWKVIAGASRKQLSGSFFDDLNLLKAVVLPEENHFVVNGYANLWTFENDQNHF